eukprot:scaffold71244_cov65-Phaeocystis_antarctica.AAC.2
MPTRPCAHACINGVVRLPSCAPLRAPASTSVAALAVRLSLIKRLTAALLRQLCPLPMRAPSAPASSSATAMRPCPFAQAYRRAVRQFFLPAQLLPLVWASMLTPGWRSRASTTSRLPSVLARMSGVKPAGVRTLALHPAANSVSVATTPFLAA